VITPTAVSIPPAVIDGPSDVGTFNIKSNCSGPSRIVSGISDTLTLLIVIPLPNVAVSVAVLKSTPPVSQTLFSQYIHNNAQTLHCYLEQTLVIVLME